LLRWSGSLPVDPLAALGIVPSVGAVFERLALILAAAILILPVAAQPAGEAINAGTSVPSGDALGSWIS
jgi:hypothetical protein